MKRTHLVWFCRVIFSRFLIFVCLFAAFLLLRDWFSDWKVHLAELAIKVCMGIP